VINDILLLCLLFTFFHDHRAFARPGRLEEGISLSYPTTAEKEAFILGWMHHKFTIPSDTSSSSLTINMQQLAKQASQLPSSR
jgi:hypothetical protein